MDGYISAIFLFFFGGEGGGGVDAGGLLGAKKKRNKSPDFRSLDFGISDWNVIVSVLLFYRLSFHSKQGMRQNQQQKNPIQYLERLVISSTHYSPAVSLKASNRITAKMSKYKQKNKQEAQLEILSFVKQCTVHLSVFKPGS